MASSSPRLQSITGSKRCLLYVGSHHLVGRRAARPSSQYTLTILSATRKDTCTTALGISAASAPTRPSLPPRTTMIWRVSSA